MNVDKSGDRVRRMFAEIAAKYDRMNHLLSLNVDKYWRWKTVQLLQPTKGAPILDTCTGTGDLAFAFWKATNGESAIMASDFCGEMLQIGESKKSRLGVNGQVTFLEADTQALPFDSDQFEIVSVAFGLRNVSDTDRGLEEMRRVCKPGGQVAILEFSKPQIFPLSALYKLYFRFVLPKIGQLMARNQQDAYNYLPQSVQEFPSGEALADRMRRAGLQSVWFRPLTLGIATLYVGVK